MKVLGSFATPRGPATAPGRVVLCDIAGESPQHPFVTWWENTESGGFCSGNYFDNLNDAKEDFSRRIKRGF